VLSWSLRLQNSQYLAKFGCVLYISSHILPDGPVTNYSSAPRHNPHTNQAQQSYFDILFGKLSEKRKTELTQNLKHYCELDTLEMVEIIGRLVENKLGSEVHPFNFLIKRIFCYLGNFTYKM